LGEQAAFVFLYKSFPSWGKSLHFRMRFSQTGKSFTFLPEGFPNKGKALHFCIEFPKAGEKLCIST
jgi:hypothetical protein